MALQVAAVAPLISGRDTLYLRDVLNSHLMIKGGLAAELRQGRLPVVDPLRGGQPVTGNPNSLPFYPDNLLYLVGSDLWALNAHFWIHFLIAPWSFFWLGRRLGLSPPGALAGGAIYASSGFYLSHMTHYNLVAGAALAPAFLAACLATAAGSRLHALAVAGLWALLLFAGDPQSAALSLLAVAGVLLWSMTSTTSRPVGAGVARLVAAGGMGSLLAAPQIVELLRILPVSYRGFQRFSPDHQLFASWRPLHALEWLIPGFFGPFDQFFRFWGRPHFDEGVPFLASLHLGVVALALVLAAGWRGRLQRLGWAGVAIGLFLALGSHNPLLRPLLDLPGATVVRFPVRAFLLVTLGLALLAAIAIEEAFVRARPRRATRARRVLLGMGLLLVSLAGALAIGLDPGLGRLIPAELGPELLDDERRRWSTLAAAGGAACLLAILTLQRSRRFPVGAIAALLAIHVASQLAFLRPAMARDRAFPYVEPPGLLAHLEPGTRMAQSVHGDLFDFSPLATGHYPDASARWYARRAATELYPFMGIRWGVYYDLALTPEGLDTYLASMARIVVSTVDDAHRLRLLRTWGTEVFLLSRPLEGVARSEARLLARKTHYGSEARLYALENPISHVRRVSGVRWAADPRAAVGLLLDPAFDPETEVVLAGTGDGRAPASGTARILREEPEVLEVVTTGEAPGILVYERAHLPIYRATVDGRDTRVRVANLYRIGVEVPAGEHRVRLWVDRRPLRLAFLASGLALVLTPLLLLRRRPSGAFPS